MLAVVALTGCTVVASSPADKAKPVPTARSFPDGVETWDLRTPPTRAGLGFAPGEITVFFTTRHQRPLRFLLPQARVVTIDSAGVYFNTILSGQPSKTAEPSLMDVRTETLAPAEAERVLRTNLTQLGLTAKAADRWKAALRAAPTGDPNAGNIHRPRPGGLPVVRRRHRDDPREPVLPGWTGSSSEGLADRVPQLASHPVRPGPHFDYGDPVPREPVIVPTAFAAFARRSPAWASWLDALPRLLDDVLTGWDLTPDGPAGHGQASLVLPVRTDGGRAAVLKLGWPHSEAEHEHLALKAWAGQGAVQLIRADPRRFVLLLERARADRPLTGVEVVEACEVIASLYERLHRPALPQLRRLSRLTADWAARLARLRGDPAVPRRFVDAAVSTARALADDPATDGVLLHTDFHYDNVLAADREYASDELAGTDEWLAIDPKPLSGDPAYEVAPLLWNRWDEAVATGNIRAALLERFFTVVDAAGLDEDRARAWVLVREMVNVLWELEEPADGVAPDTGWITAATTIVKAVQP